MVFPPPFAPISTFKLCAGDPSILDPEVGVVLVGLDFHLNYLKYALAYHYIRRGAAFLATNIDSTLPNSGTLFPGAGSMSAPLIMMLGKVPTIVPLLHFPNILTASTLIFLSEGNGKFFVNFCASCSTKLIASLGWLGRASLLFHSPFWQTSAQPALFLFMVRISGFQA